MYSVILLTEGDSCDTLYMVEFPVVRKRPYAREGHSLFHVFDSEERNCIMRDYWNNVESPDEEKLIAAVVELVKKAQPLTYSEMQELRNAAELCDRGHFEYQIKRLADKVGEKVPAGLDVIMEDPDFDVRVSFMKAVVAAVDPAPVAAR